MDQTDRFIIEELKKNCKITMKELGEKVHLSGQATSNRVIKLEELGVIQGYKADVNDSLYGYPVHTLINIYIKDLKNQSYLKFIESQQEYIIHNYKISGDSCYILECHFPSNEDLDHFLTEVNHFANYRLNIIIKDC